MNKEEIDKYREYSSRELNHKEWIEYLKLCEKSFKGKSKYLYIYYDEIKEINKGIDDLQQENKQLKEKINKVKEYIENELEWDMPSLEICDMKIILGILEGGSNE